MPKIAGETCYTTEELIKKVSPTFSRKRLEHLKNLRLVPSPIKVGTGNGTIGYYPEYVVEYVKSIEVEHDGGRSYPDIMVSWKGKIHTIDIKVQKAQRGYQMEKELRRGLGKSLMTGKHPEAIVKELSQGRAFNLTKISDEIKEVRDELKHLLKDSDDLSGQRLSRIKLKIELLEKLEAMRNATAHLSKELGGRTRQKAG